MDNHTPEQRRKNMQHIRSKDTEIELLLRKTLWHKGYRYRKNYKKLPGKPDIAITKYKVAVFCDGEYFHGKNWETRKAKILEGNNPEYWVNKIERNIARDKENDEKLKAMGWAVLRFWGKDIKKDIHSCITSIDYVCSAMQKNIPGESTIGQTEYRVKLE